MQQFYAVLIWKIGCNSAKVPVILGEKTGLDPPLSRGRAAQCTDRPVREKFLWDCGNEAALMSSSSAVHTFITVFVCVCMCFLQYQDLGSTDGPPRNWKGIGIAMVVILAVMSLVILSVILLTPGKWKYRQREKKRGRKKKVKSCREVKASKQKNDCEVGSWGDNLTFCEVSLFTL